MKKTKGCPPITLSQAADALGMTGPNRAQRLRRFILNYEKSSGQVIMIRRGGQTQVRYLVTLSLLREKCPHLLDLRSDAVETLREHFESYDARFKELQDRDDAIVASIRELRAEVRALRRTA